jgi:hypothetical protein
MSRSDIPITCLIRYRAVARLQLSHFCCPDTAPRVGCLCDFPICVIVTVTTFALVTFHTNRVFARFNMLWALASRHLRANTWFGELRSPPLTQVPSILTMGRSSLCTKCSLEYQCDSLRLSNRNRSCLPLYERSTSWGPARIHLPQKYHPTVSEPHHAAHPPVSDTQLSSPVAAAAITLLIRNTAPRAFM